MTDAEGIQEVRQEPGLISVSTGDDVMFGHVTLICLTSRF